MLVTKRKHDLLKSELVDRVRYTTLLETKCKELLDEARDILERHEALEKEHAALRAEHEELIPENRVKTAFAIHEAFCDGQRVERKRHGKFGAGENEVFFYNLETGEYWHLETVKAWALLFDKKCTEMLKYKRLSVFTTKEWLLNQGHKVR